MRAAASPATGQRLLLRARSWLGHQQQQGQEHGAAALWSAGAPGDRWQSPPSSSPGTAAATASSPAPPRPLLRFHHHHPTSAARSAGVGGGACGSGAFSSAFFTSASSSSADAEMHGTTVLAVRHRGTVVIVADGQISMGSKVVKPNARKLRRLMPASAAAAAAAAAPTAAGVSATTTTTTAPTAASAAAAAAADDAASLPGGGLVIGGFAGSTADGITLFERLEARLREHPGQLRRAAVDLAKAWRQDRVLRRLKAAMLVADASGGCLEISGNGDVLEPSDGVHAIGSGARYALAAARALVRLDEDVSASASASAAAAAASSGGGDGAGAEEGGDKKGLFTALDVARRAMRVASDRCVYTNNVWTWEGIDERTGEAFSGGSENGVGVGVGGGVGGGGGGGGKTAVESR